MQVQRFIEDPGLYINAIEEVTSDAELELICTCAAQWEKAAIGKMNDFKNTPSKRQVAKDTKYVAQDIQILCSKQGRCPAAYSAAAIQGGQRAVFVAYDNKHKIQGAALVDLEGDHKYKNILDEIIVNPERNFLIGKKAPIKGTGTKLIQAVAKKVLQKEGVQNLTLFSVESAVPFYKKLGFEHIGRGPIDGSEVTEVMCARSVQLEKLVLYI